jgi:hypothetical protein
VFDDDVALDVRDAWEDLLAGGASPAEASRRLIKSFAEEIAATDDGPIVWLALASLQLDADALDPAVAERARSSIEPSLERWREEATPEDYAAREAALAELRRRLDG